MKTYKTNNVDLLGFLYEVGMTLNVWYAPVILSCTFYPTQTPAARQNLFLFS